MSDALFARETDLCSAYLGLLPAGWTAYPETEGWDILLSHNTTGFQIGIEAKLSLNHKVIAQAMEPVSVYRQDRGPDCRAVLVPEGGNPGPLLDIAKRLSLTVIRVGRRVGRSHSPVNSNSNKTWIAIPGLPEPRKIDLKRDWMRDDDWFDQAPANRCRLPEYIPDVAAGSPAPVMLSEWKVRAIKICVLVERRHEVTRADFLYLKISASRWMDGSWLSKSSTRGHWRAGPRFPADTYRKQHPSIYAQIEADFDSWAPPAANSAGDNHGGKDD